MLNVGDYYPGETVRIPWSTTGANGASITRSTNGTVAVYKDGGVTESSTGVTDTEDFDTKTGLHYAVIDTSADGTFYSAGSAFDVAVHTMTVDSQVVNAWLGRFTIGKCLGADVVESIPGQLSETSKTIYFMLKDIRGNPYTGLVFSTSGLSAGYMKTLESGFTAITLATQTATGAYSSGGFVHIANGVYRLDTPNAVQASIANYRLIRISHPTIQTKLIRIELPVDSIYTAGYSLQQIADAAQDLITIDGDTLREMHRGVSSALMGINHGSSTAPDLWDRDNVKSRIISNSDRTSLTVDLT